MPIAEPTSGVPTAAVPRGRHFRQVLAELATLPGVRGGLLVGADGLPIAVHLPGSAPVEALSALAAALGRELEVRAARFRSTAFTVGEFAGEDGGVLIGAGPVGFLVLLSKHDANTEGLKQALRAALEALRRVWPRG
jgi:predicted regulator of Ras-like GTPase activity (Roadblock/LC7/MglB family)